MNPILTIILCLIVVNIFIRTFKKIKIPYVISLILSGIIIGGIFKDYIIQGNESIIIILGDLGIFFLMFVAGLNSSKKMLKTEEHDSLFISLFAMLFPFLLSFLIMPILGYSKITAVIIGICMSITAEATNVEILLNNKKLKTKLGSVIVEAGIIDDVLGIVVFILLSLFLGNSTIKDIIIMILVLMSFFFGLYMQRIKHYKVVSKVEHSLNHYLIPFFFISMGLNFKLDALWTDPLLLVFVVCIAIIGKLGGTLLAKFFVKLKIKQLYLIGWAMNSRGVVGLILAFIAFNTGLISLKIYSVLIIMAFTTTLIFPFVISLMIKSDKNIMNE